MNNISLTKIIANAQKTLRKSEQKVANFVLKNAQQVIYMRIIDLAKSTGVSEPTVVRFCHALNFDGFLDFKLALAQEIATSGNFKEFSLNHQDSITELHTKTFDSVIDNLINTRDQIDTHKLEQAVNLLAQSQRVEFYGFGALASVCTDGQQKFQRMKINANACSDTHMQAICALNLKPDDVIVAISQTGQTKSLLQNIKLAQATGAKIITLCPADSPMAELADVAIQIDLPADKDLSDLMCSRVEYLVVIDVLAVGVAMKLGAEALNHLKAIKRKILGAPYG